MYLCSDVEHRRISLGLPLLPRNVVPSDTCPSNSAYDSASIYTAYPPRR